jgi:hypothetical protein
MIYRASAYAFVVKIVLPRSVWCTEYELLLEQIVLKDQCRAQNTEYYVIHNACLVQIVLQRSVWRTEYELLCAYGTCSLKSKMSMITHLL